MSTNTQEGLKNTLQDSPITLDTAQSDLEDSDIEVFEGVGNPEHTNTAKEQQEKTLAKAKLKATLANLFTLAKRGNTKYYDPLLSQ
jgi:hypothetical protein